MAALDVKEVHFFVYQKSGRHHHDNDESERELKTRFNLMFLVQAERLGCRIRIDDDVDRGSVTADVALTYEWSRPATPDDDLEDFVRSVAIPQTLDCASAILCDVARGIGARVPFYGLEAVERLRHQFDESRKASPLSERLARDIAKAAKKQAENSEDTE